MLAAEHPVVQLEPLVKNIVPDANRHKGQAGVPLDPADILAGQGQAADTAELRVLTGLLAFVSAHGLTPFR